jgi:hypothetical protein
LLCSFLKPPITSSLFGPNILLGKLFSDTLSLCSSLNVRDQVSHPYRTTGKTTVLYILILKFFDSRRGGRWFWISDVSYILRSVNLWDAMKKFTKVLEKHAVSIFSVKRVSPSSSKLPDSTTSHPERTAALIYITVRMQSLTI